MANITVRLTDERMLRLREIADRLKVAPEELARFGIEELLSRPDEECQQAMEYVLRKNADLYRRLA